MVYVIVSVSGTFFLKRDYSAFIESNKVQYKHQHDTHQKPEGQQQSPNKSPNYSLLQNSDFNNVREMNSSRDVVA
jgi:hypothetical protein